MGKKKASQQTKSESESLKDQGNKAFMDKEYEQAVNLYTEAIEKSTEPNHIYFSNRANALLELCENERCIEDCQEAIKIEKTFVKAYYRQALAQVGLNRINEAKDVLDQALQLEKENELVNELYSSILKEMAQQKEEEATKDTPARKKMEQFVEWHRQYVGDGVMDKVAIKWANESNRTMVAKKQLKRGEVLLRAPFEKCLTLEYVGTKGCAVNRHLYSTDSSREKLVNSSECVKKLLLKGQGQQTSELRALKLNVIRDVMFTNEICSQKTAPDATFGPWYDILPTDTSHFPLLFNEKELQYLHGTTFLTTLAEDRQYVCQLYQFQVDNFPNEFKFTQEDWIKSYTIYHSRCFAVSDPRDRAGEDPIHHMMVPLADMLNHTQRKSANAIWFGDFETGEYLIKVKEEADIKRGDEILTHYAQQLDDNIDVLQFWVNYGFIEPEYLENVYYNMAMPLSADDTYFQLKQQIVPFSQTFKFQAKINFGFINMFRFKLFDEDQSELLLFHKQLQETNRFDFGPYSSALEIKLWTAIKSIMMTDLQSYGEMDLEASSRALDNAELSFGQRTCLQFRIQEIKIAHWWIQKAELVLELLQMSSLKEAKKKVNVNNKQYQGIEQLLEYYVWPTMQ